MLDRADMALSIRRQCMLLGIARSGVYRPPRPANDNDPALIRRSTSCSPPGRSWARGKTAMLKAEGLQVNRKRVQRLMRKMGIAALGPRPNTTRPALGHKIYPYLLRSLTIDRPNQVWAADITYLPLGRGFLYLVAIIDWASRAVLAWRLSNTMEVSFCVTALEEALAKYGTPEIFNTDQGTSISRAKPTAARLRQRSRVGSPSTTIVAFISPSAIARRCRSGANGCRPRRLWTWWTTLTRRPHAHLWTPPGCKKNRSSSAAL
ncbi:putative transposase [Bradyrhizobium sp. USDA 3256]